MAKVYLQAALQALALSWHPCLQGEKPPPHEPMHWVSWPWHLCEQLGAATRSNGFEIVPPPALEGIVQLPALAPKEASESVMQAASAVISRVFVMLRPP
ncbi:MAG: hypothetical protein AB7U38_03520 [Hyphomicrobiales bacterium]